MRLAMYLGESVKYCFFLCLLFSSVTLDHRIDVYIQGSNYNIFLYQNILSYNDRMWQSNYFK
jgi:hypothetical protein